METNPILDIRNQTAQIGVALAASLFGKSIL
jgi:arginase family enzyme